MRAAVPTPAHPSSPHQHPLRQSAHLRCVPLPRCWGNGGSEAALRGRGLRAGLPPFRVDSLGVNMPGEFGRFAEPHDPYSAMSDTPRAGGAFGRSWSHASPVIPCNPLQAEAASCTVDGGRQPTVVVVPATPNKRSSARECAGCSAALCPLGKARMQRGAKACKIVKVVC